MRGAALASLSLWLAGVVALGILWQVGRATGVLANIERLVGQFRSSPGFHFSAVAVVAMSLVGGVLLLVIVAGAAAVAAVLVNLMTRVAGGVDIAVQDRSVRGKRMAAPPTRHERPRT